MAVCMNEFMMIEIEMWSRRGTTRQFSLSFSLSLFRVLEANYATISNENWSSSRAAQKCGKSNAIVSICNSSIRERESALEVPLLVTTELRAVDHNFLFISL